MKIAFVSSGNSIHVKKLANGLVSRGHDVTLYTLPNHTKLINDFDEKVKVVLMKFGGKKGYYLNAPILRKMLKKENYDIINCHYVSGYGTLTRLANVKPIVTAVFGSDVYEYPFKSKHNMKRIIRNLDASKVITSTSNVMANVVKSFYNNKPIYVTPFGINIDIFKPINKDKNRDIFNFGTVKKLEDKYGIQDLIKAFSLVLSRVEESDKINIVLSIYGSGSKENDYKKLVEELGIKKHVRFKGFIKNELVPEAFADMDVACFPSKKDSESFGVAAVEAMACGIPVIVSDASGFTEVVEDLKCGYIIPKNDIESLAEKMLEMFYMDKDKLSEMGSYGLKRVHKLYNLEDNLETYIKAISQAIEV